MVEGLLLLLRFLQGIEMMMVSLTPGESSIRDIVCRQKRREEKRAGERHPSVDREKAAWTEGERVRDVFNTARSDSEIHCSVRQTD